MTELEIGRLKRLALDKHSTLFARKVICKEKSLIILTPEVTWTPRPEVNLNRKYLALTATPILPTKPRRHNFIFEIVEHKMLLIYTLLTLAKSGQ